MTYPSGNQLNYSYDAAGRLSGIVLNPVNANGVGTNTANNIPLLGAITYAPFGGVTGWQWGAGPTSYARTYDLDGRVASYNLGNPATTGVLRTMSYDAASRITAFTHTGAGTAPTPASLNQSFSYDDLNRLTGFTAGSTNGAYQYDLSGNRTGATFGTASYVNTVDASSNRLAATTGPLPAKTNSYDANGNLLGDGTTKYTYNIRNRMYNALVGSLTVTQVFNGFGQRMQRSNYGGMFVYDEQGHLIGEYDTVTGNMTRETVYLGDLPVTVLNQTVTGTAPAKVTATNVYNIYPDYIGTPRLITRATDGKIVWRWDNGDPFGLIQPNQNPSGVGTFTFNLRMPGQYYDRDTNLFYNYFRDYDPQLGRYVQSDPIGIAGGINTYAYVLGNPVSRVDPLGLQSSMNPGDISRPGRIPGPFDILTPGTQANNDFVKSVSHLIKIVKDACTKDGTSNEQCKKDADDYYNANMTECDAYYKVFGPDTWRACTKRATDRLAEDLRRCDGK